MRCMYNMKAIKMRRHCLEGIMLGIGTIILDDFPDIRLIVFHLLFNSKHIQAFIAAR